MINVVDIFCGCGGLSLGFQKAGFNVVRAFDNWDKAVDIYNRNFDHEAELVDAYNLTAEHIKSFSPDVIIGGPPCQDYSSAGKQDEHRDEQILRLDMQNWFARFSLNGL